MRAPSISLVIGGAASGKSDWAEGFAHGSGMAKVYIATAEAGDDEMAVKIAVHRRKRMGRGWRTVEAPLDLPHVLSQIDVEEIAVIDCATFWLANTRASGRPWRDAISELVGVMQQCPAPLVMVTNELGQGIVPAEPEARAFRNAHGEMNQKLAEAADLAVFVTAGLPQILKGKLPW
ncbi:MAG: bifunctional adenosylcobinamide kinase/adenosylcobinamide-phosphate guanylyltransferase [Pseudomonadota bacterium]